MKVEYKYNGADTSPEGIKQNQAYLTDVKEHPENYGPLERFLVDEILSRPEGPNPVFVI